MIQVHRCPFGARRKFLKLWAGKPSPKSARVFRAKASRSSPAQMGWLGALGGISALIAGPVAGAMADRRRRKPLMIAADLGRALVLACLPLAYFQGWLTIGLVLGVAALALGHSKSFEYRLVSA